MGRGPVLDPLKFDGIGFEGKVPAEHLLGHLTGSDVVYRTIELIPYNELVGHRGSFLCGVVGVLAVGAGLGPAKPFGRRFSEPLDYQLS